MGARQNPPSLCDFKIFKLALAILVEDGTLNIEAISVNDRCHLPRFPTTVRPMPALHKLRLAKPPVRVFSFNRHAYTR